MCPNGVGDWRTRLHVGWIFIYNRERSRKLARFEQIRVHEEESYSLSMNMMIFFNATDKMEIAIGNSMWDMITCLNQT